MEKQCKKVVKKRSGCVWNWFNAWRIPFLSTLRFIYWWAEELTPIKWCQKQMMKNVTIDWNSYMKEVCSLHPIQTFNGRISDANKIVKTDESFLYINKTNIPTTVDFWRHLPGKCFDEL